MEGLGFTGLAAYREQRAAWMVVIGVDLHGLRRADSTSYRSF